MSENEHRRRVGGASSGSSSSSSSLVLREKIARNKMYERMGAMEEIGGFLAEQLAASRRENAVLLQRLKEAKKVKARKAVSVHGGGGKEPLEVFPTEVWTMMLEHITTPQDLAACYRTQSIWAEELKPRKPEFLFHEVLPILVKMDTMKSKGFELTYILNFRRVCQSWRSAVDSYLERNSCHFHLDDETCLLSATKSYPKERCQCSNGNFFTIKLPPHAAINKCMDLLNEYPNSNIFLNRHIKFDNTGSTCNGSIQYWNNIILLLRHMDVGKNIWYCDFNITTSRSLCEFYKIIHECLEVMPNLKVLNLFYLSPTDELSEDEITRLETGLSSYPLPKLESLVVLKTSRLPHPFINQFVRAYGSQLTKFQFSQDLALRYRVLIPNVEEEQINTEYYSSFETLELPNLEAFSAPIYSLEDCLKLAELVTTKSKIQTLSLIVDCSQYSDFQVIFDKYLSKFYGTLKILNLRMSVDSSMASGGFTNVCTTTKYLDINKLLPLPNLLELRIVAEKEFDLMNIDFILSLKNLKKLTVVRYRRDFIRWWKKPHGMLESSAHSILKFYGYFDRLYESNIWDLLPKLMEIRVKVVCDEKKFYFFVYTRNVYERKRLPVISDDKNKRDRLIPKVS